MTTNTKTQTRGICQCCGRDQAVMSGLMSKHGYTVDHGWFNGVCDGRRFRPMEIDRSAADATVRAIRAQCVELRNRSEDMAAGRVDPQVCTTTRYDAATRKAVEIPFAEGTEWQQRDARASAVWKLARRAEIGASVASSLEACADKHHGQPLRLVPVEAGPAPIIIGEHREGERGPLTCCDVRGARVYWKNAAGFKGWTGSQAWRRLPLVP